MNTKERRKYNRDYREKNKEKSKEKYKKWYEKNKENKREYYQKHKDKIKEQHKDYYEKNKRKIKEKKGKIKFQIMQHYGNGEAKCACCREDRIEFLTIDHINNDGAQHRREINKGVGPSLYNWLIKNNYPKGFQVLCFNCNSAKGFYGYCPHKREKQMSKN